MSQCDGTYECIEAMAVNAVCGLVADELTLRVWARLIAYHFCVVGIAACDNDALIGALLGELVGGGTVERIGALHGDELCGSAAAGAGRAPGATCLVCVPIRGDKGHRDKDTGRREGGEVLI